MTNILVTGGCGYIGSHTVLALLEKGYFVYIIDSFLNSNKKVLDKLEIIIRLKDKKLAQNLKFFKGDNLLELGYNGKSNWDFHFMRRF